MAAKRDVWCLRLLINAHLFSSCPRHIRGVSAIETEFRAATPPLQATPFTQNPPRHTDPQLFFPNSCLFLLRTTHQVYHLHCYHLHRYR